MNKKMRILKKQSFFLVIILLGVSLMIIPTASHLNSPEKVMWNSGTHRHIAHAAIEMMPEPWKTNLTYYKTSEPGGESIWYYARQPDDYRDNLLVGSNEWAIEFGRHYNDYDYRPERLGTVENHPQPIYNSTWTDGRPDLSSDYMLGVVEWAVENYTAKVTESILTGNNWTQVLIDMCWLSHYVSDAWMPFHAVSYYDGQKTPATGPENGSIFAGGHDGIHSAVEGNLLERPNNPNIRDEWQNYLITNAPNYSAEYADPWAMARQGTSTGQYYADLMIAADNESRGSTDWYNTMWNACGDFYMERILNSSIATANVWYTAFVDAGLIEGATTTTITTTTAIDTTTVPSTTTSETTDLTTLELILIGSLALMSVLNIRKRRRS